VRASAPRYLAVLGILLIAGGPLAAAPASSGVTPAAPVASHPTPAQIHQVTAAVLSQGKYRREPNPLQEWLLRRLAGLWQRISPWLERLLESHGVAQGAQIVFYAVAGVVVLVILLLLARLLLSIRRRQVAPALPRPARPLRTASPTDLQAQAAALAARGEYGAALRLLQQACLVALDRRGLLVIRTSSTNGEYLRQLRQHPEPRALLATVLSLIELYLYGGRPLEETDYRQGEESARALLQGPSAQGSQGAQGGSA
jgi:hypothetical protein